MRHIWFSIFIACTQEGKTTIQLDSFVETEAVLDQDGDGYFSDEDCDDSSIATNPGAVEICDGIDNNCDGNIDEGVRIVFFEDADGDGFGNESSTIEACEPSSGYVPIGNDCDDDNPQIYPTAIEVCDGIDNNCDGLTDDGITGTWYPDGDGDGYGNTQLGVQGCAPDDSYIQQAGDCNDTDPNTYPDAIEICDQADNDCDGIVDEDVSTTYFRDGDNDGFGDVTEMEVSCEPIAGYVENSADCDDLDSMINPAADEYCDGIDNDCDGQVDDAAVDQQAHYLDGDGDGFGNPNSSVLGCTPPQGYVDNPDDCDDGNSSIHPQAIEYCNGNDDNCDGSTDGPDSIDQQTYYADNDGDTYGITTSPTTACSLPAGHATNSNDCDDTNPAINPAANELCNQLDDDCDGDVDEGLSLSTWYSDGDGDGFGDPNHQLIQCNQPYGHVSNASDCDDGNSSVFPGATELCNGLDDDCDGTVDGNNAVDNITWYIDMDNDGYGSSTYSIIDCTQPNGWADNPDDCDDSNANIHPTAPEICNQIDDDCDGTIDTNSTDASTWYIDNDCDGYGNPNTSQSSCDAPLGYTDNGDDCDDNDPQSHPNAPEICLSTGPVDHDCDGVADNNCEATLELPQPSAAPHEAPEYTAACASAAALTTTTDTHIAAYLPMFMTGLENSSTTIDTDVTLMDYSTSCNGNPLAAPGNFPSTQAWPGPTNGNAGVMRFRGYIHLRCGDPLSYTMGLIGNDAVALIIENLPVLSVEWGSGQWKRFRYVTFPTHGMYAFEVRWSTNFNCGIDPMELIWSEGFVPGYDNYNTMCNFSTCTGSP